MDNLPKKVPFISREIALGAIAVAILLVIIAISIMLKRVNIPQESAILILLAILLFGGISLYLIWRVAGSDKLSKGRSALMNELDTGQTIALVVENNSNEIVYCNALFKQWFPYYEDGVAKAIADRFGSAKPDIFAELKKLTDEAFAGYGQRREIASADMEGADWFEITVHKMSDNNLAWQIRDISLRKHQFERAGDRLALLSRALDRAPFGIIITDSDLIVKEANTAFRKFVEGENIVNRNFLTMIMPEERESVEENLRNVLTSSEEDGSLDVRLEGDGAYIVSIHATQAILTSSGKIGLLMHIEDLTERKRLETQFAQSQKMQAVGQLAGGIAHDFNNMLTAIIGFCDLLLQRHQPGNPSFSDTMQIKQNANRAAGLVRQLLAFSRQQTLRPRVFNLSDILAELSVLLRRLMGEKIELEVIHGRDLGHVKVDQGQIEQAIINLAVNAKDAMPEGGRLIIQTDNFTAERPYVLGTETMPPGDYVMLSITDTGIGIPPENFERLFEPFYTTKEVGQGTGLGLSMVYGTVRQAGGFIFVHSDGVGCGATLNLYLPRVEEEIDTHEHHSESETNQDDTGGGRVLLVEDEDPVRLFSARALRSKGYIVTEARTGEAALEILVDETFDLLITDMMMPKVDGATLVFEARKTMPDLPVICMSGYTQEAVAQEVAELPRVYFLPKPFSLKQLARKVKDAIDSQE